MQIRPSVPCLGHSREELGEGKEAERREGGVRWWVACVRARVEHKQKRTRAVSEPPAYVDSVFESSS